MRRDYDQFLARDTEILSIGPEGMDAFQKYWAKEDMPFPGLPDPTHRVAKLYRQQVKLIGLGRMPATLLIDKAGRLRYQHFGDSMSDIPPNEMILGLLDEINHDE